MAGEKIPRPSSIFGYEYRFYKLINVIKGKAKKRRQPMILYITTLGTVIDGPLMDFYVLGGNILDPGLRREGYRFRFDMDALLRTDAATQAVL